MVRAYYKVQTYFIWTALHSFWPSTPSLCHADCACHCVPAWHAPDGGSSHVVCVLFVCLFVYLFDCFAPSPHYNVSGKARS